MKKLILIMFLSPLFICGLCNKDEHWNIAVVNNSNIDIYFSAQQVGGKYYNNLIPEPSPRHRIDKRKKHIQPGETTSPPYCIQFSDTFEDILAHADSIRVFFYDADAYDKIEDEMEVGFDYSDPRIYLGYKSYTLDDFIRLNWKVTYPF